MFVIDEKDILGYSKRSRSGLFHTFYETELQMSEEKNWYLLKLANGTPDPELSGHAKLTA